MIRFRVYIKIDDDDGDDDDDDEDDDLFPSLPPPPPPYSNARVKVLSQVSRVLGSNGHLAV